MADFQGKRPAPELSSRLHDLQRNLKKIKSSAVGPRRDIPVGPVDISCIPLPGYARPPPSAGLLREVPHGTYAIDPSALSSQEWKEGMGRGIMAAIHRKPWRFTIQPTLLTYAIPTASATFCARKNIRYHNCAHGVPQLAQHMRLTQVTVSLRGE
jgi:hypothetical protein